MPTMDLTSDGQPWTVTYRKGDIGRIVRAAQRGGRVQLPLDIKFKPIGHELTRQKVARAMADWLLGVLAENGVGQ